MAGSIPASAIVDVIPNVIDAGGTGLELIGAILTTSTRVPIGTALRLTSAAAVSTYFGPLSVEYGLAQVYFDGYDGSTAKPAALLFWQYPTSAVAAYLRGGAPRSLASLQALTGTLTMTIDGRSVTSSSINLGTANSYSDVAALIQSGLADKDAQTTGSISGTTLTVTSGTGIAIGQTVAGAGVTAGTKVVSGSGTSWVVNISQTVSSTTLTFGATTVAYDSTSGAFVVTAGTPGASGSISAAGGSLADALALSTSAGAVTSQGSAIATPSAAMDALTAQTQNFVSFATTFEPNVADAFAFATWTNGKDDRFVYVSWDTDAVPAGATDTTSLMYQVNAAGLGGTVGLYAPVNQAKAAAFVMGAIAAINFNAPNGRVTLKFRSTSGLFADVSDETIAANLEAHGYNFYAAYATANQGFVFLSPGQISGEFRWIDSYVNQIQLNNALQLALLDFLTNIGRVPYNDAGFGMIEQAMSGPVQDALAFGSITAGVSLSQSQIAQVNAAAGRRISDTISTRGWYILVLDPGAQVRAARGSPLVYLFYCDGQSVQKITVSSTEIE